MAFYLDSTSGVVALGRQHTVDAAPDIPIILQAPRFVVASLSPSVRGKQLMCAFDHAFIVNAEMDRSVRHQSRQQPDGLVSSR